MGRDDVVDDERLRDHGGRIENLNEVDELLHSWMSTRPRADVAVALQEVGVPAAAVRVVDEVVRDEAMIGEHNRAVFAEFAGLSDRELDDLEADDIITPKPLTG